MPDQFSTNFLIKVIQGLPRAPMGLLQRYFPQVIEEESEEIHFDRSIRYRLMAPFVSPRVEGQIMEERGFHTDTFKPAYVKPKTPLDPTRAVKRVAGEQIGGSLSPEQRQMLRITNTLQDHLAYIDRRLEWMAAQALLNGAVTVAGDKYRSVDVDFGREAALEVTLTSTDQWDDAGSDPLGDLSDWSVLAMQQPAGAALTDFIMDPAAFKLFRNHADVQAKLDTRRELGSELIGRPQTEEGLHFKGTIDGFNIWVYQAWYETTIGTLVPFFPANTVVGATPAIEGVQHFGAILDEDALMAMAYYPKSWVEPDPSRRFVMTQSAPLVVPGRPNASLKATVT